MVRFIAIILVILAETLYDSYAPKGSTSWSIIYFSATYVSYAMICVVSGYESYSKILRIGFYLFAIFFAYLLGVELVKINMDYCKYLESVSDRFVNNLIHYVLMSSLILISLEFWNRFLKHKKNVKRRD